MVIILPMDVHLLDHSPCEGCPSSAELLLDLCPESAGLFVGLYLGSPLRSADLLARPCTRTTQCSHCHRIVSLGIRQTDSSHFIPFRVYGTHFCSFAVPYVLE